jgi:hypothetical protein
MLLEARIDPKTVVYIDAETAGGFAKGGDIEGFNEEQALDNVVRVATLVGRRLAETAGLTSAGADGPTSLDLCFAVKIDGNSVVSIAKNPDGGQFRVTARWAPR